MGLGEVWAVEFKSRNLPGAVPTGKAGRGGGGRGLELLASVAATALAAAAVRGLTDCAAAERGKGHSARGSGVQGHRVVKGGLSFSR